MESTELSYGLNDMNELLKKTVQMKGSDLLLVTGSRPAIMINGRIESMDYPILKPNDVQALVYPADKEQREKLEMNWNWIFFILLAAGQVSRAM